MRVRVSAVLLLLSALLLFWLSEPEVLQGADAISLSVGKKRKMAADMSEEEKKKRLKEAKKLEEKARKQTQKQEEKERKQREKERQKREKEKKKEEKQRQAAARAKKN